MKNIKLSHPLEFISAYALTLYGLWLLAPWWNTFSVTVSFRVMLYLAPEEVWELLIFAAGVFQGWARLTGKIVIRQIAATISIFLWSIITFSVAFSNIASTAAAIYSVVILINVLILIYLARDGGQKHDIIT